jgi:hypothetical protein
MHTSPGHWLCLFFISVFFLFFSGYIFCHLFSKARACLISIWHFSYFCYKIIAQIKLANPKQMPHRHSMSGKKEKKKCWIQIEQKTKALNKKPRKMVMMLRPLELMCKTCISRETTSTVKNYFLVYALSMCTTSKLPVYMMILFQLYK